jgi:hypothetical protein
MRRLPSALKWLRHFAGWVSTEQIGPPSRAHEGGGEIEHAHPALAEGLPDGRVTSSPVLARNWYALGVGNTTTRQTRPRSRQ